VRRFDVIGLPYLVAILKKTRYNKHLFYVFIYSMSKTCLRCNKTFNEAEVEDENSQKYPSCPECWKEWTTNAVMVMNEMRLDMSLPEHRKALRKYERGFFEKTIGEIEKNPENK